MTRGFVVKAAVAAGVAVAAFAVAWALWPSPSTPSRARQYLDVSACLLTGPSGIAAGTPGARAWHELQSASLSSHVMVSYLPATGPADVPVMLTTLAERRCGVIVVTAATPVQVATAARANRGRRFILVTTGTAAGSAAVPANAVVVPAAKAPDRIDQEVSALAGTA